MTLPQSKYFSAYTKLPGNSLNNTLERYLQKASHAWKTHLLSPTQSGFCRRLLDLFWNSRLVWWGQLQGGGRVRSSTALIFSSTSSVLKVGCCICRHKARRHRMTVQQPSFFQLVAAFIARTKYDCFSKPELYKEVKSMFRRKMLSFGISSGLVSTRVSIAANS